MIHAYNYMLLGLPSRRNIRYSVSNRNELKKVYDRIVNLSMKTPFYKVNLSRENQEYTIGVKEAATDLKLKLKGIQDEEYDGFNSKTVEISDKRVVDAKLLVDNPKDFPEEVTIKVKSLASVQINRGRDLFLSAYGLPIGEYQFTAKVKDQSYQLKYIQQEKKSNKDVLKSMADYLNHFVPGIHAMVESGASAEYSHLAIVADQNGRFGEKTFSFEAYPIMKEGIIDFFDMNRMEQAPSFAQFEVNGVEKQTATNVFTLENTLQISLLDKSPQPVTLRIVADGDKILSELQPVLNTCNILIELATNRTMTNEEHYRAERLISEIKSLEEDYQEELEACGLKVSENGALTLDDTLSVQAAKDGGLESLFTRENGFIARLLEKAETIAINPLEYVEKIVITYPNTEKNSYRNPYITSMYSGLFFNSYC